MNKEEQKKEVDRQEEYIKKYKELCDEYSLELAAMPTFLGRDDGTFSVVLKFHLQEIKKPAPGIDKK